MKNKLSELRYLLLCLLTMKTLPHKWQNLRQRRPFMYPIVISAVIKRSGKKTTYPKQIPTPLF